MIDQPPLAAALARIAFSQPGSDVYAVLDGCMIPQLPERLQKAGCRYSCLFSGRLDPALAEAAPYLVALDRNSPFTRTFLHEGWNNHWGIVLQVKQGTDLYALRHHLRRFLRVGGPGGQPMLFRFYDPRAFRISTPVLGRDGFKDLLGPMLGVLVESEDQATALHFTAGGSLHVRSIPLLPAAAPA